MWDQPPPGEVGGAKLEVTSTELRGTGQKAGKNWAILTMGSNSSCHQGAGPTRRKLKKLLISHVTGQLCMLWEFTILSCTRSDNEPSATRIDYMWWYEHARHVVKRYSFELRPLWTQALSAPGALASAGSVVTIGLTINACSHSKNTSLTRQNKIV